jgi:hypothetical protein
MLEVQDISGGAAWRLLVPLTARVMFTRVLFLYWIAVLYRATNGSPPLVHPGPNPRLHFALAEGLFLRFLRIQPL